MFRRVCVFCGSNAGGRPEYRESAEALGRLLVARGCGLVYGGGSVGLMGVIADAVLAAGGEVQGVIPKSLATRELLHPRVEPMHVVEGMHARKSLMAELADAFIAMPGGYGTFEELFEVITWAQLGLHAKPIGLLNVAAFFDPLVQLVDHAVDEGFVKAAQRELIVVEADVERLFERLETHRPPAVPKWIRPEQT
ncbi:MAG TPA: TIGR00730 family Rossman fold protein [Planctomycetaceae bacterium]|nr:TIGR00730 family Rossman fold protein [Planctomycetaceae bacterium]